MITAETIRELLQRKPFEPFEVRLSNGDAHPVKHPECVAITKARLVMVDPDTERLAICSILHVASIAMIHPVGT